MSISREIVRKAGILPKLQLGIRRGTGRIGKDGKEIVNVVSTGKHTVKFVSDKIIVKPPREEGDDGHCMRYVFEENGEKKQYDTRLKQKGGSDPSYFVQAMAEVEEGEELVLEMKKAGIKNYVEITRTSVGQVERADTEDEEDEPSPSARRQGVPEEEDESGRPD